MDKNIIKTEIIYVISSNGFVSYNYHYKITIEGNEDLINTIRSNK